jgi:hypothetical protein
MIHSPGIFDPERTGHNRTISECATEVKHYRPDPHFLSFWPTWQNGTKIGKSARRTVMIFGRASSCWATRISRQP